MARAPSGGESAVAVARTVHRDREGVALKPIFGLPFAIMATGLIVIVGGASLLMRSRRSLGCSLAFVNFTLLDQRDRPEELRDRDHRADNQPG